jgi:hypothetical protein
LRNAMLSVIHGTMSSHPRDFIGPLWKSLVCKTPRSLLRDRLLGEPFVLTLLARLLSERFGTDIDAVGRTVYLREESRGHRSTPSRYMDRTGEKKPVTSPSIPSLHGQSHRPLCKQPASPRARRGRKKYMVRPLSGSAAAQMENSLSGVGRCLQNELSSGTVKMPG